MYIRNNKRERQVIKEYSDKGYNCLTKGYPDICFFNDDLSEVFFIEVKRKQKRETTKNGLSNHQKKMIEIFRKLGLKVEVRYIE